MVLALGMQWKSSTLPIVNGHVNVSVVKTRRMEVKSRRKLAFFSAF